MHWTVVTLTQLAFTAAMYALGAAVIGLGLFPGVLLGCAVWRFSDAAPWPVRSLLLSIAAGAAFFLYGVTLILVVGAARVVFRLTLCEGDYPMASPGALKWAFTNAFSQLVNNTFMEFMVLTPLASLFYRVMGAKVGRNVQINSSYCADLSLLELGDGAVIGGHATVICHSFERGTLILRKVKIGRNALVGLNAVVLPGADIGDNAIIAAGAVLPKDARVEPGSVYRGSSNA